MDVRKVSVADMLLARDRRVERQKALQSRHAAPLISFTMNIAGEIKRDELIQRAFFEGVRRVREQLDGHGVCVLEEIQTLDFTGCEQLWCVRGEATSLKRWMQAVEEADELGRLFDVDVIDPSGARLGRGYERRCLICGAGARGCARARTHPAQELYLCARSIIRRHFERERAADIARCAQQALLCEALVTPKPGLVDRENSGAHSDMDIFSFALSAGALHGYFESCASVGMQGGGLEELRLLGRRAEADMLRATGGANTHKGAIFSLGILCCAAGRAGEGDDLLATAAEIAAPALEELQRLPADQAQTGGERQYLNLGLTGVRGEAAAGFPTVQNVALPALQAALKRGKSINDAGLEALMALMSCVMDSNVIRRGGVSAQNRVHARAKALGAQGCDIDALRRMNDTFVSENISPGGCADLLAIAYFLHFYESVRAEAERHPQEDACMQPRGSAPSAGK